MLKKFLIIFYFLFLNKSFSTSVPEWIKTEIDTPKKQGIYEISSDRFLAVGVGRITLKLNEERAIRFATNIAENNAKIELAEYLWGEKIKRESPRKFSVKLSNSQIVYNEKIDDNKVVVGILVPKDEIELIVLSPFYNSTNVKVAKILEELMEKNPILMEGGASIFPNKNEGWMAVGVGISSLDNKDANKIALNNAKSNLTEVIYGTDMMIESKFQETSGEKDGIAFFKEWEKNTSVENVKGLINGVQVAGQWITDDNHLAIAIIVAEPKIEINFDTGDNHNNIDIEEQWKDIFLSKSLILNGGVSLYKDEKDTLYLLVVEKAKLQGIKAIDKIQTPNMIETKARTLAVNYLNGSQIDKKVISVENIEDDKLKESLTKISKEKISGAIKNMKRVGSWKSEDEKNLVQAFVLEI